MNDHSVFLRYNGFSKTHFLWGPTPLMGLNQIHLPKNSNSILNTIIPTERRLGKLVEHFVFNDLENTNGIEVLARNIQIKEEKITIGEIDTVLKKNEELIHLEVVFKFYLYDKSVSSTEIHRWIGPNRKDSLIEKLTKIKEKQFPILFHQHAQKSFDTITLDKNSFQQNVYFKAQLFVPLKLKNETFPIVNNDCISGVYLTKDELKEYSNCLFFIPSKLDWLLEPNDNVVWHDLEKFEVEIHDLLQNNRSPLCWMKNKNGELSKLFVVWW